MAVDYFLKVDGIEGESNDKGHKGEIDIESWSWGLSNPGSASHGGGGGAGKASFQDFSFTTQVSKASPKLFLASASGQHIRQAILTARKSGGDQLEFYKVTMSDLLVSSYQQGGAAGDELPTDQVSLNFSKIEVWYREQDASGKPGDITTAGWDLAKNVKI